MAQAANANTTSRRKFLSVSALAGAAAIATAPAIAAAISPTDPIFAAIQAHGKADAVLAKAYDALEAAERELDQAGDLNPCVISVGNPYGSGEFPSMSHAEIDMYSPADMYPDRNRSEHMALAAAFARRDARLKPLQETVNSAEAAELKARRQVEDIEPTTVEGAFAALKFTRKYTM